MSFITYTIGNFACKRMRHCVVMCFPLMLLMVLFVHFTLGSIKDKSLRAKCVQYSKVIHMH